MSASTRLVPSRPNRRAALSPIPDAAPVTSTTLPSKRLMRSPVSRRHMGRAAAAASAPNQSRETRTMTATCSIPTPTEAIHGAILDKARSWTGPTRHARHDPRRARGGPRDGGRGAARRRAGRDGVFPRLLNLRRDQTLYATLCGADPETLAGGNARTAFAVIQNRQAISRHRWVPISPRDVGRKEVGAVIASAAKQPWSCEVAPKLIRLQLAVTRRRPPA